MDCTRSVAQDAAASRGYLTDFKQFLLRGNVVDLAVGIVIGTAFGAVVTALVADLITPLISAIFGSVVLRRPRRSRSTAAGSSTATSSTS